MTVLRVSIVGALSIVSALAIFDLRAASQSPAGPRVLVFTKTAGFRHASIPAGVRALRELGSKAGLAMDVTEDASAFKDANLRRYRAVVFLLTTGDVLGPGEQAAFERFVRNGGGFAGVHSASDTEHDWPWYGRLVGAYFRTHPAIQSGVVRVEDSRHPSTRGLPSRWTRTDEWYSFASNPRGSVRVLANLDESSYDPGAGAMGRDHPIAWAHEFERGRAWYTAGGHTDQSYAEPLFRRHLLGGIRYAAGLTPPRIRSVSTAVRERRVAVTVRYASCRPCRGRLEVASSRAALRTGGGVARGTSRPLGRGRHRLSIVLEDPLTGVTVTARRSVVVP